MTPIRSFECAYTTIVDHNLSDSVVCTGPTSSAVPTGQAGLLLESKLVMEYNLPLVWSLL